MDGIRTQNEFAPKRAITKVMVEVDGKMVECKAKDGTVCDSIFCSESSIQKFLLLYYHAQRILSKKQWKKLYAALNDSDVVVIGHVWPSHGVAVEKPRQEQAEAAQARTDEMFYVLKAGLGVTGGVEWEELSQYQPS